VVAGPASHPWKSFFSKTLSPADLFEQHSEHAQREFTSFWPKLTWTERSLRVFRTNRSQAFQPQAQEEPCELLVCEGPVSISAALLAAHLGWKLQVVASDLSQAVKCRGARGPIEYVIMMLSEEAKDVLLTDIVRAFERELSSERAWEQVSKVTLMTGRDLASLSWLVAKTIASNRLTESSRVARLVHLAANSSGATEEQLHIPTEETPDPLDSIKSGRHQESELISALTRNVDVIAYQTHGTDACAKGGAGVVLCGLRSPTPKVEARVPGILACGRQHTCPRGPYPIPLRELSSRVLMLASCNSLRLGDSSLQSDFNLGLSFLDGAGLAYVGTVFSALGDEACSRCFLAAMATGYSLSEATALVNALLSLANLDHAAYIAVGAPDYSVRRRLPVPTIRHGLADKANPFEIDFGTHHLRDFLVENAELAGLAENRQLVFDISASTGERNPNVDNQVFYFHRPERPLGGGRLVLRVFVYRFPESLGRLRFRATDRPALESSVHSALASLRRWLDQWRLCGMAQGDNESFQHLAHSELDAQAVVAQLMTRLGYDGSASRQLERQEQLLRELSRSSRDLLLIEMAPRLAGPFWLTNEIGSEYRYEGSLETRCPNCRGIAISKLLRHSLHGEARAALVCPRCLTVSDLRRDGTIASVLLHAPETVTAGQRLQFAVTIQLGAVHGPTSLVVTPRLSTHGLLDVPSQPPIIERTVSDTMEATFSFEATIPPELPPHQYFLKLLAATDQELGFASRMVFVC
jgi:hypothetical protein